MLEPKATERRGHPEGTKVLQKEVKAVILSQVVVFPHAGDNPAQVSAVGRYCYG